MKQFLKSVWIQYKKRWKEIWCVILVGLFFLIRGLPCPIKYLTGISCPGCGMTRAIRAAVRLDFAAAFYYHPLWVLLPVLGILYLILRRKKAERYFDLILMIACGVMLVVYIYRLLWIPQGIVVWKPENGLIAKGIEYIRGLFLSE